MQEPPASGRARKPRGISTRTGAEATSELIAGAAATVRKHPLGEAPSPGLNKAPTPICTFHPVGPGWTKPQGLVKTLTPFVPRGVGLVETPFCRRQESAICAPLGWAGGDLFFINMHISPRRARLDETSRADEVPYAICSPWGRAGGDPFLSRTRKRHLRPVGPGWWRPVFISMHISTRGAGLDETLKADEVPYAICTP